MALRNTPTFETEDDVAVVEATAPAQETVAAAPAQETVAAAPAEQVAAATAIVAATTKRTAVSPLTAGSPIKQFEWAIPAADLENFGIGVFPRITVGLDGFSEDKTKELGKEIKISIISYNPVWLVTAGEKDNKEADKMVRSSYDGLNLKGGEGTVADYVQHLKTVHSYKNASCKQYMEMYCRVLWTKEGGDVAEDDQKIYQLSLSPTSVGRFQRYVLESALLRGSKTTDHDVVVVKTEKIVNGSNQWAVAVFSAK